MTTASHPNLSGRRAQAARNDQRILQSARAVFLADPGAPITAVARHAGVGISALYSRYGSKEELLRKLCTDGLNVLIEHTRAALAALAGERDDWAVFTTFMRHVVAADTSSMTLALAGTFTPTPEMFALADRAAALLGEFFDRVAGVLRPGLTVHDLSLVFEMLAAIKTNDAERTRQLRQRYLAVVLAGLRAGAPGELPGTPPTWQELNERWQS